MAPAPRRILRRGVLVLFGVCLCLLMIEGALRIGALFVGRRLDEPAAGVGAWRMLSVGDSNTYGLYLDKSQAYPKVLEKLWNAHPTKAKGKIEAFNLGFPGTNSSKLAKDFRRMLWTFRPDVVTVMIGANDLWTVPETAAGSPDRLDRLAAALWRVSRAYRLLYIALRGLQVRQLEVTAEPWVTFQQGHGTARYGEHEFDLGWTMLPKEGIPGRQPAVELKKNLEAMAAQATDFGTKVVFLTYASDAGFYSWANGIIRDAATATGTPLIDVAAVLKPGCPVPAGSNILTGPGAECPELFPDQHPSALGHQRIADILAKELLPALDQPR